MSITLLDVVLAGIVLWLVKTILSSQRSSASLPPGPKGLPLLANLLDLPQKEQWKTFADWGRRYGPIVHVRALGQSFIILNDVHVAGDMLDKKSAIYSDRPVFMMAGELTGWKDTLVFTPPGERFKEYRKYLHGAMGTRSAIEKLHGLFETETQAFLKRVLRRPEAFAENIRDTAGSVILQVTYGYKPKQDQDDIVDLVEVALRQFTEVMKPNAFLVDLIPPLRYVPSWFPGAGWKRKAEYYHATVQQMADVPLQFVRKQMSEGVASLSMVSSLLDQNNTPEQERNIKWASASMYSVLLRDTPPTWALTWALQTVSAIHTFFLAMTVYPEVQRKAQAEIDAVVGNDRLLTFADRPQLPYVDALISEILRWGTVAPLGVPHTLSKYDIHDGYFIPEGAIVLPNVKGMLHDPDVYPDPWNFKPERFVAEEGKPAEQDPRSCCFGFGRRRSLKPSRLLTGLNLADATVWASVAMSLAVFDIQRKVVDGVEVVPPEPLFEDEMISHPTPFGCSIKPRSAKAESLILGD
ncbi:cytochrome P450 [Auriscalpium vulgare]|uniref:Cytochrome P450 n=1 Tax=Auriscalpium vulgare TaxID=40419 RepID=A0ACB8R8W8_9AGAM|nr:cytochrome P450 [Auriscalpium vulgare]